MSTLTRRHLVQGGIATGISATTLTRGPLPTDADTATGSPPEATQEARPDARRRLDAATIPKYEDALVIPPAMPLAPRDRIPAGTADAEDYYEIELCQFDQQVLPASMDRTTTVWGYAATGDSETKHSPAFTIEAGVGRPVRVRWTNRLVDDEGRFLPHLLPVDPTLHWANPGAGEDGKDYAPRFEEGVTPEPYTGPVPMVVHLHGASTEEESDGFTTAWYLPDAIDIPDGYAHTGSMYAAFSESFAAKYGQRWSRGSGISRYDNQQAAATLWFHDHVLGITRLNVYAGPAGFYLLRGGPGDVPDGVLPGPAPRRGDEPGKAYYEIPLAIQDRSFSADGQLSYPESRAEFDGFEGPYIPESDIHPIINPEVFGDAIIVNGHTWPSLTVEPRRYRFRLLNGCNSRFLILRLVENALARRPAPAALEFHQIGSDSGFLPRVVSLDSLFLAPAERADVIVDFTGLDEGTELYLINEGPDEPFGGGEPGDDFEPANPDTTGQVMQIVVGALQGEDTSRPVDDIQLPQSPEIGPAGVTRRLALMELDSDILEDVGPREAVLGIVDELGHPIPLDIEDPLTEAVTLETPEIWEFWNFTADAHPIHVHEVQFEVINRQEFDDEGLDDDPRPPEPWETGRKDTVIAYPEEVTRIKLRFVHEGMFVWHCHILEHEDNEMMRPIRVLK
jgi:spore coat protein A, manganese oxidase